MQRLYEQAVNQFHTEGVRFSMRDHLMLIEVENEFAKAVITPHGACVLGFTPKQVSRETPQDLLWVSPTARYDGQKAVRGGIPVCWPWFGKASVPGLPAHGFVRNRVWQLDRVVQLDNGITEVVLSCEADEESLSLWPHHFSLKLTIEIGETLALSLTTINPNDYDLPITEALHTYFNVSQATGLRISGLQGSTHLDKLDETRPAEIQNDILQLQPPRDSVYLDQSGPVDIDDAGYQRKIRIEKHHSESSVVWNPGPEIVKGFDDIPDEAWPDFACVESGNVLDNAVTIPSGEKHTLTVIYSLETL